MSNIETTTEEQGQQDTQVDAGAAQDAAADTRTAREAFDSDIAPLLSLLNARCQQHNISTMIVVGLQGETIVENQREQEILLNVTPYQSGMVPKPIHDCLGLLESQLGAATPEA